MMGILFNDELEQMTSSPPASHRHPSGHGNATLAVTISNHAQNIRTGDVIRSVTNATVALDGTTTCCNLHRELKHEHVSVCYQYIYKKAVHGREFSMGGACSMHGRYEKIIGGRRHRLEDNIKGVLKIGYEGADGFMWFGIGSSGGIL
jgi:hypothetical protein